MAYESSVTTSPMGSGAERISRSLGMFAGKCDVSDYGSGTLLEITGITRNFVASTISGYTHGIISVIAMGLSDNGYEFRWDYTTGAFKAYTPTAMTCPVVSNTLGAVLTWLSSTPNQLIATSKVGNVVISGVAKEEGGATDVGEISFIAIGFIR